MKDILAKFSFSSEAIEAWIFYWERYVPQDTEEDKMQKEELERLYKTYFIWKDITV